MDKLAKIYLKIRSAKEQVDAEYKAKLEDLDGQLKTVAAEMKDQMLATGVTSMRTPNGTIMLHKKVRFWSDDWESMKKFIKEHDELDLLERRIAQKNMQKFLDENPGLVPPGLNADTEITAIVRKTT